MSDEETLDECIEETEIHPKALQSLRSTERILTTKIRDISNCQMMEDPTSLVRARSNIRQVIDAAEKSVEDT